VSLTLKLLADKRKNYRVSFCFFQCIVRCGCLLHD
jgi:hypothetical protein